MTSQDKLVTLYQNAIDDLQKEIDRREASGRSVQYQRRLLKKWQEIFVRLKNRSPAAAKKMLEDAALEGARSFNSEISAQIGTTFHAQPNLRSLDILAKNTADQLIYAANRIGRILDDTIRQAGLSATKTKISTGQTVDDMRKLLLSQLKGISPNGISTKRGHIRLDAYARMVARSTTAELQNTTKMDMAREHDYDLAMFTSHTPTCELCAQYEDRVFALTREAANGKYKGPNGEDLRFPYIFDTAFKDGYNNIHPNCRHRLTIIVASLRSAEWLKEMSEKSMMPFTDTRTESERRAYAKAQADNRARWQDRRQWEAYRAVLPDQTPKTFAGWKSMKRLSKEKWRYMQIDYKRRVYLIRHPETALPCADNATAADEKFTRYLFNPEHPVGYPKGVAITSRLGYNIDCWQELKDKIIKAAPTYPVVNKGETEHGVKYEQLIILYGNKNKPGNMKVAWMVNGNRVWMTTCFLEGIK